MVNTRSSTASARRRRAQRRRRAAIVEGTPSRRLLGRCSSRRSPAGSGRQPRPATATSTLCPRTSSRSAPSPIGSIGTRPNDAGTATPISAARASSRGCPSPRRRRRRTGGRAARRASYSAWAAGSSGPPAMPPATAFARRTRPAPCEEVAQRGARRCRSARCEERPAPLGWSQPSSAAHRTGVQQVRGDVLGSGVPSK